MKTQAAILVEQHKDLVLAEVELPVLSYGQVLVEIKATRICGSQLGEIDGVKGPDKYLPHLLGHEAGVVVLETGPEVLRVKAGDRAVAHWRPALGIQARPSVYSWEGRKVNAGNITTFQQYAVISENRLTPVPADTDFDTCALLADTLTTGFGAVTRDGALQLGESCLIAGVGGIGLGVVLGAHLAGAAPIVAIDIHDHKLEKAAHFGATLCINAARENVGERLSEAGLKAFDIAFDVTGQVPVIEQLWSQLGPKGRLLLVGVMRHDRQFSFNTLPLHFGKSLRGSEGGSSLPHLDIPRYLRLIQAGRFAPASMISHRSSLSQINEAIKTMRSGEATHSIIEF